MVDIPYASSAADEAQLTAYDAIVLIGWLSERVSALESLLAESPQPLPKLPSFMHGFGYITARERAVQMALAQCSAVAKPFTQKESS